MSGAISQVANVTSTIYNKHLRFGDEHLGWLITINNNNKIKYYPEDLPENKVKKSQCGRLESKIRLSIYQPFQNLNPYISLNWVLLFGNTRQVQK